MRTPLLPVMLLTISSVVLITAQEPVLIAGGSTPPTPVMGAAVYQTPQPVATPVVVGYQPTVVYVPVVAAAPVVVGGAPNVIYFGGQGRCNSPAYGGYYAPGYINPPVMYFGRREVCRRGYR